MSKASSIRDLKPANIKLRPDGTVKVLDFGLAKALEPAGVISASASMSPTITTPAMTQAGMILGTAAYMSPEQARGKTVDKRSDIWAFGVVLYEMLSGSHVFDGETISDTLAAVLRIDPDWTRLPADAPPRLGLVLRRCLAKDSDRRFRDIGDVRLELEDDHTNVPDFLTPTPVPKRSRLSGVVGSVVLLAAGAVLALSVTTIWSRTYSVPPRPELRRFLISRAIGVDIDDMTNAAISPDGHNIALTGRMGSGRAVFVHSLSDGTTREIQGRHQTT